MIPNTLIPDEDEFEFRRRLAANPPVRVKDGEPRYTGVIPPRDRTTLNPRTPRGESCPWKAQLNCRGFVYYLGSFECAESAARAYDNAAYWLATMGYKYHRLNFPEDYLHPTREAPHQTAKTVEVQAQYVQRHPYGKRHTFSASAAYDEALAIRNWLQDAFSLLLKSLDLHRLEQGKMEKKITDLEHYVEVSGRVTPADRLEARLTDTERQLALHTPEVT